MQVLREELLAISAQRGLHPPPLVFSIDKQSGYYRKGGDANFRLLLAEW